MIEVNSGILEQMVQAIVREADPELIMLFGSMASGRQTADSDVDFLVIEREPFGEGRSRRQELIRLRRALSGFRVPKDILVYSAEEKEMWKDSKNHILADVLRNGKKLYERP